ncbi:hypothetical protein [Vibrio injensis]|uniref:hypothetical protein n=1 Tax=Vibrio injensis TaxID=1307414 RepID=UPI00278BB98A|nr:hypothetical protein [Vibrio injensis]
MTRECTSDFERFKKYIEDYNISGNLKQMSYVSTAKSMHKAYFSLLHWHTEFQHQKDFFSDKYSANEDILLRISEVSSDVSAAKFNWISGSYKASRVMLRSAIENFVRALSSIEDVDLLSEKSVYALFDKAKVCQIFSNIEAVNASYNRLHANYKELCKDTHTASQSNMECITSLVDYPKFYQSKSETSGKLFVSTVRDILTILCLVFNGMYHKMHHKNRDNILLSIPRNIKPLVLAP